MNILEEAMQVVDGARQTNYGHPRDNHGTTAEMWTSYLHRRGLLPLDKSLDAHDVCDMNILQKVSRDAHSRVRDNQVDIAGFARNTEMIEEGPPDGLPKEGIKRHRGLWPLSAHNISKVLYVVQNARMKTRSPLTMICFTRDDTTEPGQPMYLWGIPVQADACLSSDKFYVLAAHPGGAHQRFPGTLED